MTPITAQQIADATGGRVVRGSAAAAADSVGIDSKTAAAGSAFVAIRGDTHDGHAYLADAANKGVSVVVIDRDDVAVPPGVAIIRVDNTRLALGRLATAVRRSFTRTKVIAVAGSNGKTSTKNALHAVLSRRLRGTASPKSFNNDIGVPLTLLPVSPDDDYVILEVGTNHPGEVEHLSQLSEPDVAVITSIGEEHLEFFGSLDAVRRENAQIVAGLRPGGLLVTCDDAGLSRVLQHNGPTIRFSGPPPHEGGVRGGVAGASTALTTEEPLPPPPPSRGGGEAFAAASLRVTLDGTTFEVDGDAYSVPAVGAHFATNALAVIAVARHFGLADDIIRAGLAAADASDMRMQRRTHGRVTVLNDAYNANPTSTLAAVDTLRQIDWPGRKIAVLGDMKELGVHSAEAHERVARAAAAAGFDAVFAVGDAWQAPATAIGATWFADSAAAASAVADHTRDGDLVLLKGSRSMKLERVATAIAARHD